MSTSILYHGWGLKDYRLLRTEFAAGAIWFHVEKKPEKRVCPRCKGKDFVLAGLVDPPPALRTLPIGKKEIWLVMHLHRIWCGTCDAVIQEGRIIAEPKKHYTHQLALYVLDLCRSMTMADVAKHLGMSWDTIKEILKLDLETREKRIDWRNVRRIAIDEISVRKGHSYMSVVLNLDTGRVLHVVESRRAEALAPFFKKLRRARCKLEAVAMDMSASYKLAVETYYRKPVAIVYDRFHVMKLINFEIDEIRRAEMRDAETPEARQVLKGQRYLLLYAAENVPHDREEDLLRLLALNENLSKAYILKEQLRLLWGLGTGQEGEAFLDEWIALANASGIRRLAKFAKTLDNHREGILNYFDNPITTGPLEGVNNSIKVLKRKAYGFRDLEFFRLRILFIHECKSTFTGA